MKVKQETEMFHGFSKFCMNFSTNAQLSNGFLALPTQLKQKPLPAAFG